MILDGPVSILMADLPIVGRWQRIFVQFLQDNDGGHEVTFLDTFANAVVPKVIIGNNRYTTVMFYAYKIDVNSVILAFDLQGISNPPVTITVPGFGGFVHTKMFNDQNSNLAVGDHLEFDTLVNSDKLAVSLGVGQAKGIFSGFAVGHTYICNCYAATEGNIAQSHLAYQFFDRQASSLIGTHGHTYDVTNPLLRSFQHVAACFFTSVLATDELEVQIIKNNSVTRVFSGSNKDQSMSFVTIKDCGITEDVLNQGTVPVPPPEAEIQFNARMVFLTHFVNNNWNSATDETHSAFTGQRGLALADPLIAYKSPNIGWIRKVRLLLESNTFTKNVDVQLVEDGTPIGNVIFTIFAATAGQKVFPPTGVGFIPIKFGKKYDWRFKTTDGSPSGGLISGSMATEIYFGSGLN